MREATQSDLEEFAGLGGGELGISQTTQTPPSSSPFEQQEEEQANPDGYQTLNIPSPAFLLALYLKAFREKEHELYEWQKEELQSIADSLTTATAHKPYKLALCAANGSGKDYVFVTPTVVWMSLVNIRCLTIITSSSGNQLTAQTENYIRALCQTVNDYHGAMIFRIRQRYIRCNLTGSEIRLFATDEAGKAEGYHPLEPNAKMVIVVNEAKSVSEEIFGALRRCTGYTHWLNVSTPGAPSGSFHRACTKPALGFRFRRIDYRDCQSAGRSHMSEQDRLADAEELGVSSALYRSKWLALFTNIDTDSLITTEVLEKLVNIEPQMQAWPLRIGGDIAAGGDENAIVASRGNTIVHEDAMREKDTVLTADWFERKFMELGVSKTHEFIFMDDGGIGHAVIDMLRNRGWEIRRIRNETRALKPNHYGNRGAELWYTVKRLAEERILGIDKCSSLLRQQLTERRYKKSNTGGRIFLESKKEAKADGLHSPDRADALVLSFTGLSVDDFLKPTKTADEVTAAAKPRGLSREELEQAIDDRNFEAQETKHRNSGKRIYNSLAAATAGDIYDSIPGQYNN
jgi:hypothetical protein